MLKKDKAHAYLSPSSSHKWLRCPGSPIMERLHGVEGDTTYADQGTAAHFLASETLDRGVFAVPDDFCNCTIFVVDGVASWDKRDGEVVRSFDANSDMVGHIDKYLENVRLLSLAGLGGQVFAEQKVVLEDITGEKGAKGTADVVAVTPLLSDGYQLEIHDLKYGLTPVGAEDNPQLLIYAAGALEVMQMMFEIKAVSIHIHQPRRDWVSSAFYNMADFHEMLDGIKAKAKIALAVTEDDLPKALKPGVHCTAHYCRARSSCKKLAEWSQRGTASRPVALTIDELAQISTRTSAIRAWCDEIDARRDTLVKEGTRVPGFKLVKGKEGNRKWAEGSEDEIARLLTDKGSLPPVLVYKRTLASPTTVAGWAKSTKKQPSLLAEEVWKELQQFIERSPAKDVVVPADDPRPEVSNNSDDFEDIS